MAHRVALLVGRAPIASFNHLDRERKVGSIGTPVEGVEMRVVDDTTTRCPRAGSDGCFFIVDTELIFRGGIYRRAMDEVLYEHAAVREAVGIPKVIVDARDLLGGNGILSADRVIRRQIDIEAIYANEGTETVQRLVVGHDVTRIGAFA